ncbi:MAG: fibronectin type III domain-containing protein [Actinobacteria bacterium]|uniref:Fibronectin type III domain-containing protein n=1 Tax=Candidatus Fonsibacter lacus TaxID=2576439 RepID=A0A965LLF6_9PROT|nr:fibronectin type III domain-containing protein [Candidatus Fonsibacter lacus]
MPVQHLLVGSWQLPVDRPLSINSGSYLAGYARSGTPPTLTATPTAGVGTGTITFTSTTTSVCTVNSTSGLVAFITTGTCTITAAITEAGGFTSATSPAISFSVRATPGVPTSLAATPGNGQVTISWSAPTDTGGGISSYLVTASPGGATCSWSSGPLNCAVTDLSNGTSYSFTVASVNSQGSSAASLAVLATPRTVPGAPSITNVTPLVQDSWKLVYQTTSPTRSGGAIVYSNGYGKGVSDQAAQLSSLGTSFNRIRYRMEVN